MTNHYFTNQPETAHNRKEWAYTLRGKKMHFITDSGVFSKGTVDFGSRLLIETFNDQELVEGTILDVGCGYGPIGLSIAATSEREVEMVDVNERAIALAKENAQNNQINNVNIHVSNIYEQVEQKDYAAILSNPPIRAGKKVVHTILSEAYGRLKTGGVLMIVIQKKQGAPSAEKKMLEIFSNAEIVQKSKGYYIIQSVKK